MESNDNDEVVQEKVADVLTKVERPTSPQQVDAILPPIANMPSLPNSQNPNSIPKKQLGPTINIESKEIDDPEEIFEENNAEIPSTTPNTKSGVLQKINEKSRIVCSKLKERRLCLENLEKEVNGNEEATRSNDLRAFQLLKLMRDTNMSKNSSTKTSTCTLNGIHAEHENGGVVHTTAACIYGVSGNPTLSQHTKKQLKGLVEGLQELLTKLTMNDTALKSKAQHLAVNINTLKSFPLFLTDADNIPSTSQNARNQFNSDVLKERHNSHHRDSERSQDLSSDERVDNGNGRNSTATKLKGAKCIKQKKERKLVKSPELSPQELLLNYVNNMISEYISDQQQDTFDKVKCTLNSLDDLEKYAQLLVQAGLGRVVEGEVRVNRKNNRQAFVTLSNDREGTERDGIILLPVARRYAFDGDIVRAFVLHAKVISTKNGSKDGVKPRRISSNLMGGKENSICLADDEDPFDDCESSPDTDIDEIPDMSDNTAIVSDNCPKAFVINIVKQTELREVVGSISFKKTISLNSKTYYKLKPHDMKNPMVYILANSCQEHINAASKDDIVGMIFLAHVLETDKNGNCIGELLQPVGKVGNLEAEMKAILLHNGLKDLKPYDQKFHDMFDGPTAPVTENDLKYREDLRTKCVFTIDPLTARDLDDAVSVEKLSEDEYEIGVHISDVSYYLEENSELDNLVKERATSIYLVNEVVHMLPSTLCYRCSLLPGEDKFAFSVFWRWNVKDKILSEPRFTRSVINSCSQFAYEHAQKIIDNPEENFGRDDFPEIFNKWTSDDIKWRVLVLHSIAQHLKGKRYESGALSINNPKLRFSLHPITGEPISYEIEGRQEANYLIEEFMLLANQAVAKFIHQNFPDNSILRNHAPPLQNAMRALKDRLANLDLDFDIRTSKSVYESMQRISQQASDPKAMDACLSTLLTKPMARARYYCSEGRSSEADFWHYALSIPIYTHFTSPIRRYPDILVHRLLAASLFYCPPPQRTTDELHQLAKICNDQKFNAKNAGDESIDLFFVRYIRAKESITLRAVVTDIFKHMLSVVTIETGHTFTITYKLQKVIIDTTHVPSFVLVSEKNSQLPPVKLQLFSTLDIRVALRNNKTCGFIVSPDKTQRRLNSKESSKMRDKYTNNNSTANGIRNNHNSTSEQDYGVEKKVPRFEKRKERVYAVKGDE